MNSIAVAQNARKESGLIARAIRTIVVDLAKLRDYCLAASHPRGRHKARVCYASLGQAQENAEVLRQAPLDAARDHRQDLRLAESDRYGNGMG